MSIDCSISLTVTFEPFAVEAAAPTIRLSRLSGFFIVAAKSLLAFFLPFLPFFFFFFFYFFLQ